MPGRKFSSGEYRFGFNGKENDREWGNQLIQDYGFRLYNPAIGKFLSVDPLSPNYPMLTPYQFASNTPIVAIDLDGLESWIPIAVRDDIKVQTGQVPNAAELANNMRYAMGYGAHSIYEGIKYTGQGAITYTSMGVSAMGNAGYFLTTGSVGRFQAYNAFNGSWYRQGNTLASQEAQNETAWWGISEGAGAVAGVGLGGLYKGAKNLLKVDMPSSVLNRKIGGAWEKYRNLGSDGYWTGVSNVAAKSRSIKGVNITREGVQQVQEHLSNPYFFQSKGNQIMIDRLKKIADGNAKATDTDLYFYTHELREKELINGVYTDDTYYKYHAQTSKEYGIKAVDEEKTYYTKEANDNKWTEK